MERKETQEAWEQALVSIITPVYNVEPWAARCFDSILAQTWTNWELILIDDGSTDSSGAICDAYAARDARIRVFHQANCGVSAARNVGLDNARGDYVLFADPDDWLAPEMVEGMMRAGQGAELVVCGATNVYINRDGTERYVPRRIWKGRHTPLETTALDDDVMAKTGVLWNKLFRRDVIGEVRFDKDVRYGEDVLFLAQVFARVHKAVLIPAPWYFYRKNRPGNVVSARPDQRTEQFLRVSLLVYRLMKERGAGVCGVHRVMIAVNETFAKIPWNERKKYAKYIKACGRTLRQTSLRDRIRYARDKRFLKSGSQRMGFLLKTWCPMFFYMLNHYKILRKGMSADMQSE